MNPILKEEHMLHLKNISLFHKREKKEGKNKKNLKRFIITNVWNNLSLQIQMHEVATKIICQDHIRSNDINSTNQGK